MRGRGWLGVEVISRGWVLGDEPKAKCERGCDYGRDPSELTGLGDVLGCKAGNGYAG